MTTLSFITPVSAGIEEVERRMLAQADGYHPDLRSALHHLLASGGKRIRPALTLLTGQMLGGDLDRLITLATSIELLHTATLVHDDLIDGSLLRRGIPTLNSQWSPGATVLTGDFIFARAARTAAATESVAVIKLFAQTLTTIVNGEVTQLFTNRCLIDREGYYQRIYAKTASLFETATTSAAYIANVDDQQVMDMRYFGYEIGMAFQIIDDILDFTGEQGTIGKPVGNDLRQGIFTLPTLYYLERHPQDPCLKTIMAQDCFGDTDDVNELIEAIRQSDAINLAFEEAQRFVESGIARLKNQANNLERRALEDLALYIAQRQR